MSKHMRIVWCLAFSVSASLHAAEASKGMVWSGGVMGGYNHTWKGSAGNASGFSIDRFKMRLDGTISNTTKVVMQKAIFLGANNRDNGALDIFESRDYTSGFGFSAGTTTLAFESAYIDHKCGEGWQTWVGLFPTPFGMESMWDRLSKSNYYYSRFMADNFYSLGVSHDLGVKFNLTDILPGTFEFAVMDGRTYNVAGASKASPAVALRWSMESKSADMSLTPVVSAYFGRFEGFAKTWMAGAGVMGKFGALGLNGEFLYGSDALNSDDTLGANKNWSIYVEPSMDLGMAEVSLKAEFMSMDAERGVAKDTVDSVSDIHLGATIGHTYEGNFNVKLAYNHYGLNNKVATPHINDVRLLVSTTW